MIKTIRPKLEFLNEEFIKKIIDLKKPKTKNRGIRSREIGRIRSKEILLLSTEAGESEFGVQRRIFGESEQRSSEPNLNSLLENLKKFDRIRELRMLW